jgi:hypothetical protein
VRTMSPSSEFSLQPAMIADCTDASHTTRNQVTDKQGCGVTVAALCSVQLTCQLDRLYSATHITQS